MHAQNLGLVLRHVRDHPGCSRADLAVATGLTKPGITKLVNQLAQHGLVTPSHQQPRNVRGRPATGLAVAGGDVVGIGAELRIDHVSAIVSDLSGQILGEARMPLTKRPSPDVAARRVATVISQAMKKSGRSSAVGIGLAIGATMDVDRKIAIDSSWLGWRDVPIHELISRQLDPRLGPLLIEPAARLNALATARSVGNAESGTLMHLEIGGGAGLGVVIDGTLSTVMHSGSIGHIPLHPEGGVCSCGNRGCLDTVIGFSAFLSATGGDSSAAEELDHDEYARSVRRGADADDAAAVEAIAGIGEEVGRAIAILLALIEPAMITIGGYVIELGPRFLEAVETSLSAHRYPPDAPIPPVIATPLGRRGATLGAAALAVEPIFRDPTLAFGAAGP